MTAFDGTIAPRFAARREALKPKRPEPVPGKPVKVEPRAKCILVPEDRELRAIVPDAPLREFGGERYRLFPHNLKWSRFLHQLGYEVPSPVVYYDWNGHTPFDVQRKTVDMLTLEDRAYVLNDMGTGKTRAALWAWDYLRTQGKAQALLVIAPLSTLTFVWMREAFKTLHHRKAAVVHGSRQKRADVLANEGTDIFIINHDGIKIVEKQLLPIIKKGRIDTVVIDELAIYRNQSARWKACESVCKVAPRVWGMTGSPMPRAPTDVWGQSRLITPDAVPRRSNYFRDELMMRITGFVWVPKKHAIAKAYAVMQPAVRFALEDVVELPPVIERSVSVDLGTKQAKAYEQLRVLCHTMIEQERITAANAGAAMTKLLQLSLGWVYRKKGPPIQLDNQARMDALLELALESERKVLVFVPFRHALAGVSKMLEANKVEHATMHGGTPVKQRNETFTLFQNTEKYHVLAAHPQCLSHGVTLTRAATIVWAGPITSGEIYEQANARITRVGQKFKQQIFRLHGTPIERKLYALLDTNAARQEDFLQMFAEATAEATMEG